MHVLNVSFQIMQVILFWHLIGLNCILNMALDRILQVRDVLIYPAIMGKNTVSTIRQALTISAKPGNYGQQATLWFFLRKV